MISKRCPYCKRDSYSSYDDPHWKCPYCGNKMGSDMYCISGAAERKRQDCKGENNGNVIEFARIKEQLQEIKRTKNKCWLNGQL